jgi:hypothetical protein
VVNGSGLNLFSLFSVIFPFLNGVLLIEECILIDIKEVLATLPYDNSIMSSTDNSNARHD